MDKKTQNTLWVIALSVVLFAVLGYWQFGGDAADEGQARIETTLLERGDIIQSVATSGSVRPLITVEVGSQLSGQILEIFVDYNSPVTKDQVVALIDAKSFESRVLQNRAELSVANANIVVQQANIDRASANLRRAKLEFERAEPLAKTGTLSASGFEAALAEFESAKADLTVAEAQLENARANREQRQALLVSAEIDLERTRIRSPINGVVIERSVDKGQTVAASLSSPVLFKIAQDLTEIQVEANVDEADIGFIKQGDVATFSVDAYPDSVFSGQVGQVRLAPNELNNVVTYTVIITASNPRRRLLPGMTAIVEIVTGKSEDVLRVANAAVRFKPAFGSELAERIPVSAGNAGRGNQDSVGGRSGGFGDLSLLQAQLGLDEAQVNVIEDKIREVRAQMRSQSPTNPGMPAEDARNARRQQMRQGVSAIFKSHLSAEQFSKYQQLQRQTLQTRPAVLWISSDDGEIRPVSVRLGISDDRYTHIISRDLKAGQQAVTRIRKPRK